MITNFLVDSSFPGGCSCSQGFDCSSSKKVRELGLIRCESVLIISTVGVRIRIAVYLSTQGPD